MKIAFLGLGTMGKPMASNLAKAGLDLTVWNRSPDPSAALAAHGAKPAQNPATAVKEADVVITMLADDAATQAVLFEGGALAAMKSGAIYINMATVSIESVLELQRLCAAKSIHYLSAPVLGRVNVAEAGQLNILAAGAAKPLAVVQPLFDHMGQKTWHFGEKPEQANAVKLAVNFMIASAIGTMGEACALAAGYDVAKADFIELITTTLFAAPAYKGYGAAIAAERFEPAGFKLVLGSKDVQLGLNAAARINLPMPLASVLHDDHLDGLAHGEGHLDWAALSRVALRHAGKL